LSLILQPLGCGIRLQQGRQWGRLKRPHRQRTGRTHGPVVLEPQDDPSRNRPGIESLTCIYVWKLDGLDVKGRAAGLWYCVRLRLVMPLAWW